MAQHQTGLGRRHIGPLMLLLGVIAIGFWCADAFVVALDPLSTHSWGKVRELKPDDYSGDSGYFLFDAVAKDPKIDAILVGGSTTQPFTRQMMDDALPGIHDAFNLSYNGGRPGDRDIAVREIQKYSHAKLVIISFDWFYEGDTRAALTIHPTFPSYLYSDNPVNEIRLLGSTTFPLVVQVFRKRPLWLPNWSLGDELSSRSELYGPFHSRETMSRLEREISSHKRDIDTPTSRNCGNFAALTTQLVPRVQALSKKHIAVDILVPPYSLAMYYDWLEDPVRLSMTGTAFLEDQLLLNRCMVYSLSGLPGVEIFSFNNDPFTADLGNYYDPEHVYRRALFDYMLRSIAAGTHRLSRNNVDSQIDEYRRHVLEYVLPSKVN